MILFFNVLVTNRRASASGLNRVDRLDLFKYALASYACIDRTTEVIIYCQLGDEYKERWLELTKWIEELFPNKPVRLYPHSPANQLEWQAALVESKLLETSLPILYMGNDDHVFIDYDLDVLYEGLDLMAQEPADQINTLHFSSWTEGVSTIFGLNDFRRVGRYWEAELMYVDACQIVNSLYFEHIFFDLEMGGTYMRRTDNVQTNWYPYLGDYAFPSKKPHPPVKTFLPLRELVRHFDAYWHINVPLENCPMLDIPAGFFDRNIRINYCGSKLSNCQNWGPFCGTGDKKMIEDIPLFWKGRISQIDDGVHVYSHKQLLQARNEAHRKMMVSRHSRVYQSPSARIPAIYPDKFRSCPDEAELPLDREIIEIGYRT